MTNCPDCGTKLREAGICPNCQEELYINDYQMPEHPIPVSEEWVAKVKEQRLEKQKRRT
jgi:hypothetical protein